MTPGKRPFYITMAEKPWLYHVRKTWRSNGFVFQLQPSVTHQPLLQLTIDYLLQRSQGAATTIKVPLGIKN